MILQHFFVCSEEASEERRGVERASVHHEDKKPRNGKNLQEGKGREKPTETFHFENKDVGRWSEDYLAIGNIRQPRAVQFAVFASPVHFHPLTRAQKCSRNPQYVHLKFGQDLNEYTRITRKIYW